MASRRHAVDLSELVERAQQADPRAVARLITLVESNSGQLREVAELLTPLAGRAHVVGLTGPPGVGKSTSTAVLISALRGQGKRVGVLAVDPSSPFTGGALLGDRIRMQQHATDPGVFIRSMATRGELGGLAAAVPQAIRVLDAAGCDVVLVETVGVGQSEVEIVRQADTTVVLLAPGLGDGIQAAKAGILEIADIFVVNKADRDGAAELTRDLRQLQSFSAQSDRRPDGPADSAPAGGWRPPILTTVAARSQGGEEVLAALQAHRSWLAESGNGLRRRRQRAAAEIEAIGVQTVRRRFTEVRGSVAIEALATLMTDGSLDPYTAAERLLASLEDGVGESGRPAGTGSAICHYR